jgi:diguanylate cyclase (GGDEF)-like protein
MDPPRDDAADTGKAGAHDQARRLPPDSEGRWRFLLIEDSPDYAALVEQMLRDAFGGKVEVLHEELLSGARQALAELSIDCVLLDLSLPDASGLEAFRAVGACAPEVPVVILTGINDEAVAIQAVAEGAQDFLPKRIADTELLARSLRYAIERKQSELRLASQALHDALTELPNRVLFLDRLRLALARRRRSTSLAVLFIDLDRFKAVNDSLGHEAGDELLAELAGRLRSVLRPSDTAARFGGDEFLILCDGLHGEREALPLAARVRTAIAEPIELRGREISVHASVGVAYAEAAESKAEGLVREADQAMYRAKRNGSGLELFEAGIRAEAITALETEQELRRALEREELRLYFQPQITLDDMSPFAVEALVRWEHPQRGLLEPSAFIGLAEETGLIVPLGEWVLSEACHRLAAWRQEGRAPAELMVSVNVSPRQLGARGLTDTVARVLATSKLPASCLCLEVTETSVAETPFGADSVLSDLKGLGVTLGLDDFGTGYSSLSALTSYPLDTVKIDRSFIEDVDGSATSERMFSAICGVVRAADLWAVVEGIQVKRQLELAQRVGGNGAQGFLFARPQPEEGFLRWLATAPKRHSGGRGPGERTGPRLA